MVYLYKDYIDRVIATNGFIPNCDDDYFYTGYRVFIRMNLDKYSSVDEWSRHDGSICEYIYRNRSIHHEGLGIIRGSPEIMIASLANFDYDTLPATISQEIEKNHLYEVLDSKNSLRAIVEIHRKIHNLSVLTPIEDDDIVFHEFLDTKSKLAQIEKMRMDANMLELKLRQ